jgi:hypothetical protein
MIVAMDGVLANGKRRSTSSVRLGAPPAYWGLELFVNFEAAHPFDPWRSADAVEFVQPCVHAGRFKPDHACNWVCGIPRSRSCRILRSLIPSSLAI